VPTVALSFQPVAEHVRTARLVAVAVARRAGLDEARLDEIRLAVGEMCARAVRRSREAGAGVPVVVELRDRGIGLDVVVTDGAGAADGEDEYVSLALVRGLADEVVVQDGPGGEGGGVRMSWIH